MRKVLCIINILMLIFIVSYVFVWKNFEPDEHWSITEVNDPSVEWAYKHDSGMVLCYAHDMYFMVWGDQAWGHFSRPWIPIQNEDVPFLAKFLVRNKDITRFYKLSPIQYTAEVRDGEQILGWYNIMPFGLSWQKNTTYEAFSNDLSG